MTQKNGNWGQSSCGRSKCTFRSGEAKELQEKDSRGTTDAQQELPERGASLPAVRESAREKKMGMKLTWEKGEGGADSKKIAQKYLTK